MAKYKKVIHDIVSFLFEICPSNIFYANAVSTDNLYIKIYLAVSFLHLPFEYLKVGY